MKPKVLPRKLCGNKLFRIVCGTKVLKDKIHWTVILLIANYMSDKPESQFVP